MNRRKSMDMCEQERVALVLCRMAGGFLIGFNWLYLFVWIGEKV